eukprot:gnl/TRDRNA2_/TRDRNA2_93029_c0_seq1.p1 gnl/TRDRNA2_/TRDRNA2_93029_c0~~gnl/TRDRNA2_/TRDRNA2_93029_c0_seq1.p1  ORF type:complete len:361 (-),score=58.01 gnl/TRDRNA2_/TRDRNA2_93029_c0_seq1:88-1170(-)
MLATAAAAFHWPIETYTMYRAFAILPFTFAAWAHDGILPNRAARSAGDEISKRLCEAHKANAASRNEMDEALLGKRAAASRRLHVSNMLSLSPCAAPLSVGTRHYAVGTFQPSRGNYLASTIISVARARQAPSPQQRYLNYRRHPQRSQAASPDAHTADAFMTLKAVTRYEEVIKKSRFVAVAAPVQNADDALKFVKATSDAKARHNCFAWRLADGDMRTNGDGEPGSTAGPPILAAIDGAGLKNVVVLVMRYRLGEGAKLGTGGLVRAYGGSAAQCLASAERIQFVPTTAMIVMYDPQDTGVVFQQLSEYSLAAVDSEGGLLAATFEASPAAFESLSEELQLATKGRAQLRLAGQQSDA